MKDYLEKLMRLLAGCIRDTEPSYFLAVFNGESLVTLDGDHSKIEGVAEAKKLMRALRLRNDGDEYVMLTISPVPDIDVPINEEAAAIVGASVERYRS